VRTLLITGATGGLGAEVVARLSREYRCIALVRQASKSLPIDSIKDASQLTGPVYGVILLAGAFTMGSSPDDFAKMIDANLMSAVRAIELWRHADEEPTREQAVDELGRMLRKLAARARKERLRLARELQCRLSEQNLGDGYRLLRQATGDGYSAGAARFSS